MSRLDNVKNFLGFNTTKSPVEQATNIATQAANNAIAQQASQQALNVVEDTTRSIPAL
jgi:hypothetical protein